MSIPFDPGMFKTLFETPFGHRLWATLNEEGHIRQMENATARSRPALEPLQRILLAQFGEAIRARRARQLCGRMARQIMERLGYRHDRSGIRLMDALLFKAASRYRAHR